MEHSKGREYTFAGGAGIFDHEPGSPGGNARFRESIVMGTFDGEPASLQRHVSVFSSSFPKLCSILLLSKSPRSYDRSLSLIRITSFQKTATICPTL